MTESNITVHPSIQLSYYIKIAVLIITFYVHHAFDEISVQKEKKFWRIIEVSRETSLSCKKGFPTYGISTI